jgi:hypothetical protein
MKEYIVIKIILFILNNNLNIKEQDLTVRSKCHLYNIAKSISKHSTSDSDIASLLAIGYKESKFNYQGVPNFTSPNGKHCGIYQQSPQFAILNDKRLKCKDLQQTDIATAQALNYINIIKQQYGKDWKHICHYNSGNMCNPRSQKYAKDYKARYDQSMKMIDGKNIKFEAFSIDKIENYQALCESL